MQLICLANSTRPGGRCIAGIDPTTGAWIRPVPRDHDAIPAHRVFVDHRFLALLDIVELELTRPREPPRFQRENQVIQHWNWALRGRASPAALEPFIDDTVPILHTPTDRVDPALFDQVAPPQWNSLQLVRPSGLRFTRDPFKSYCWRARFKDRAGNEYSLRVTDPAATQRLDTGERLSADSLLTVSLTKPWPFGDTEFCYKLVAAVIDRAR